MLNWLRTLLSGKPHFYIGGKENPYLLRWYLIPRNRWFNIYLHKFLRDDDDRALHDHPWWFISIMLKGSYIEHCDPLQYPYDGYWARVRLAEHRATPSIAFRAAEHRHRVELQQRPDGSRVPCWTLVVTGRKAREWGFWCPKGFVPWHQFVDHTDHGNTGRGCT